MIKLSSTTFDDFIRGLSPFDKEAIEIDLTDVSFISPGVLTQLSALCHALHKEGKNVTIKLNNDIGQYLLRAGFIKSIRAVAAIEPKELVKDSYSERFHGSNLLLIEVTKIENVSLLPALLEQIVMVLCMKLKFSKCDAYDTATAISEVCQNTFDHNMDTYGFVAMQVYKSGQKNFLQIGISDYGDGLWKTLSRNARYKSINSHLEAINYATKVGTSEYNDPTHGTGLYHLLEILKKNSGLVQIQSGYGKVRYKFQRKTEWDWSIPYLPGVHIVLELNTRPA